MEHDEVNPRKCSSRPAGGSPATGTARRAFSALALLLLASSAVTIVSCSLLFEAEPPVHTISQAALPVGWPSVISVRLAEKAPSLAVSSTSEGIWNSVEPGRWELPARTGTWKLEADGKSLKMDGNPVSAQAVEFTPQDGIFRLGDEDFRGQLVVELDPDPKGGLIATNIVSMEDYLRGVLGGEMPSDWPKDALMAQAVAARTFAVYRASAGGQKRAYLKRTDMAYKGIARESPETDKAVAKTAGIILTYGGAPFATYFATCCGGHTSSAEWVFHDVAPPPLQGVYCGWCEHSSHYQWTATMTVGELSTKVAFWGIKNVDSIELGERDPAGRVQEVIINKTKKMSANEFRVAVGPDLIKSTAFTKVSKMGDSFEFAGKGWGHGVGMCQYGAEAMARAGRSWRKVLVHYYPYAEITKVRLD